MAVVGCCWLLLDAVVVGWLMCQQEVGLRLGCFHVALLYRASELIKCSQISKGERVRDTKQ